MYLIAQWNRHGWNLCAETCYFELNKVTFLAGLGVQTLVECTPYVHFLVRHHGLYTLAQSLYTSNSSVSDYFDTGLLLKSCKSVLRPKCTSYNRQISTFQDPNFSYTALQLLLHCCHCLPCLKSLKVTWDSKQQIVKLFYCDFMEFFEEKKVTLWKFNTTTTL